jgi:hypothetical protein
MREIQNWLLRLWNEREPWTYKTDLSIRRRQSIIYAIMTLAPLKALLDSSPRYVHGHYGYLDAKLLIFYI